ncbi:peptide deformylase [Arvimicrobium flavum]|uniref:peptide deformylase n=1 Tax=Arvimicrobium flavum TaxID=3393320 RepID=UPI00237B3AE9|nr:peptide deformylase [Mesorhizobium shangrilense]
MASRPIVMFPDARLRVVAEPVDLFGADLRALADDLVDTLHSVGAIGITAPHVGIAKRLVALRAAAGEPVRIYVNPQVAWATAETARHTEGSVSMPGVTEEVERPARVRVSYRDLDGAEQVEEADGFLAACHQHEIDQLDGMFWIQRLSPLKRDRLVKKFQKLQKRG